MKNLFAALSKAQSEMGKARKDSTNPHFRSKYADLTACVDAIQPALASNGLAYIQRVHDCEKSACVETIILHESGESIECGKVSVPVSKADAQGFGSALTYARRYSLSSAFGLATEDDDGNAAAKAKPQPRQQATAPVAFDFDVLTAEIKMLPKSEAVALAKQNKANMSEDQAAQIRAILEAKQ